MQQLNKIERVLAPCRATGRILIQHGLDPRRLSDGAFGIDLAPFTDLRRRPNDSGVLRVGFVGRIVEQKGLHVLLEAMRVLPRDLPVELSIWGDEQVAPHYTEALRSRMNSDPRIHFRGAFASTRIGEVLSDMCWWFLRSATKTPRSFSAKPKRRNVP